MKKITFAAIAVPLMWLLLLLLFFNSSKLHAQETTVLSGVVKSADGTPMEGVTVWQKDTDNGTQTSETGYYTLQVSNSLPVTFEYLGYKTQTVKPAGPVLNVTLQTDDDVLDEVVINAGYYSVKDKERTGSISKITSKEIGQQPVANPLAAMQGRMAGVNITQSSGTPGGGFDIQIRGRNSLRTEGNAPLYIVDGIPYASQSVSNFDISGGIIPSGNVSPLNAINPNDIESIEVLKDADATAIYGSRGSNGVVLITTKKGSSDKTTFSFQSTSSVSSVSKFMNLMNTHEYLQMRRDAFANDGITEYPANAYDINGTWDQNRYTDWQRKFIGGKAVSQNTQFSVGGGSGQTNYLFSASHRKDGTVFPGDFGYKRTNFLLNVNHSSKNKRFDFQGNIIKGDQKNNLMASDLTSSIFLAPNAPDLYDVNGNINWENNTFENPLAKLNAKYHSVTSDFTSQMKMSYAVFKNLKVGLQGGLSTVKAIETGTLPSTVMNPSLNLGSQYSSVKQSHVNQNNWIIEPTINFAFSTTNSKWDFLIGSTFEERNQTNFSIEASNFLSNDFILNTKSATNQRILSDTETIYRYSAVFGRINYNLLDKYIINVTGRRDGSSRFGDNNRFGNFAAVGAAWIFSQTKLIEELSWLNFGKLRASYGTSGSDLIGDYQYLNTYGINFQKYDNKVALDPLRLYNPNFSWETNKKIEAALELEFFSGRLATSVAWYQNRSSSQLVGIPLPGTTGFSSIQSNLEATVQNNGLELTLRSININKHSFKWTSSFNISLPKNKLIAFPNLEESTYANQYVIGQSTNVRKVYHLLGVNKETGLFEFEDVNKDGKIDINDRTTIINLGVKMFGGFQNQFRYKDWTVDFLWQFVKQNAYTPDYNISSLGRGVNRNQKLNDYFSHTNLDAFYQSPASESNAVASQAFNNYKLSDGVIADASFLRLKSFQLQYKCSQLLKSNFDIDVYFQGYNLITITKFWGSDPESTIGHLPALRTLAVGFSLKY